MSEENSSENECERLGLSHYWSDGKSKFCIHCGKYRVEITKADVAKALKEAEEELKI